MYSQTRCRVQVSHWERPRLFAEVSSGPRFIIRCGPNRCELCSTLLTVVLIGEMALVQGAEESDHRHRRLLRARRERPCYCAAEDADEIAAFHVRRTRQAPSDHSTAPSDRDARCRPCRWVAAIRPPQDHRRARSCGEPEDVAVQERNTAVAVGYLDVAIGGRLIDRIEVGGAVHEAHHGHRRGEVEQARVVSWIRTSPARIHVSLPSARTL
jgi:hypothetical protein